MFIRKNPFTLLSVNVPDVRDKRKSWAENLAAYTKENLVMVKAHGLNIYKYLKYLLERLYSTKMTDDVLPKLAP